MAAPTAAVAAWRRQWQRQLGGSTVSGAACQYHLSKILSDRVLQNQQTVGAAAQWRQRWQSWQVRRGSSSGSSSLVAARRQGLHDNNINQKYSEIGYYRTKRLQGQQRNSSGGGGNGSLAAWQRQRQLGGSVASRAPQQQHQSKILRDRV
jgi:hypothetical protein